MHIGNSIKLQLHARTNHNKIPLILLLTGPHEERRKLGLLYSELTGEADEVPPIEWTAGQYVRQYDPVIVPLPAECLHLWEKAMHFLP